MEPGLVVALTPADCCGRGASTKVLPGLGALYLPLQRRFWD